MALAALERMSGRRQQWRDSIVLAVAAWVLEGCPRGCGRFPLMHKTYNFKNREQVTAGLAQGNDVFDSGASASSDTKYEVKLGGQTHLIPPSISGQRAVTGRPSDAVMRPRDDAATCAVWNSAVAQFALPIDIERG